MDHLRRYGLRPADADLPAIRRVLHDQAQLDQMDQDTELMKLCCVQLFHAAQPADVRAIWGDFENFSVADRAAWYDEYFPADEPDEPAPA